MTVSRSRRDRHGLLSEPAFRRAVEMERWRSDRSGIPTCLITFPMDLGRQSESPLASSEFRLFQDALQRRMRVTDVAGTLHGDRIAVLLWNCEELGARQFVEDLSAVCGRDTLIPSEIFVYPRRSTGSDEDRRGPGSDSTAKHVDTRRSSDEDRGGSGSDSTGCGTSGDSAAGLFATTTVPVSASLPTLREATRAASGAKSLEKQFAKPLPFWKRAIDVTGASIGLLVTSPILIAAAVAIRATSAGPIFFLQKREGLGGRVFRMFKFRTMQVNAEAMQAALRSQSEQDGPAFKMTNDPRVTPVGRFLRKSCIDELPQLLNVLLGDMSLVGPRPLPVSESRECEPWERNRLDVTPGLTCIWQAYGKSRVTFKEWMRMDRRYIRERSFWLDFRLICKTALDVLLHRASV
jgi:lipopolysaccharide/colanic/teichoic acid biosynthesis glycosyltransferase